MFRMMKLACSVVSLASLSVFAAGCFGPESAEPARHDFNATGSGCVFGCDEHPVMVGSTLRVVAPVSANPTGYVLRATDASMSTVANVRPACTCVSLESGIRDIACDSSCSTYETLETNVVADVTALAPGRVALELVDPSGKVIDKDDFKTSAAARVVVDEVDLSSGPAITAGGDGAYTISQGDSAFMSFSVLVDAGTALFFDIAAVTRTYSSAALADAPINSVESSINRALDASPEDASDENQSQISAVSAGDANLVLSVGGVRAQVDFHVLATGAQATNKQP